jgi:hypothetical protein
MVRCETSGIVLTPPISHLMKTWKTAAPMREYSSPSTALLTSQKLRTRIWQIRKTTVGTKNANIAAAQMGTISLRMG